MEDMQSCFLVQHDIISWKDLVLMISCSLYTNHICSGYLNPTVPTFNDLICHQFIYVRIQNLQV